MRWLVALSTALVACAPAAGLEEVADFGTNPGELAMFEHVPANLPEGPRPLVVVLHGCSQDHRYAEDAGLVAVADELGVLLAIAEQSTANNAQACFNWFEDEDITRDEGEALSIKQMVDDMKARHDVDDARVFVTGVSSGGAMTAVMLAAYPDVFAAGAVFAGVAYRCGVGLFDALSCMSSGGAGSQEEWAALVNDAHGLGAGAVVPKPRVMIWHGTDDTTVDDANADDLVEQWTGVHGVSLTPTSTSTSGDVTRESFAGVVENVRIEGMGHGVPVTSTSGCGSAGAFFLDVGVCATREVFAFFDIAAPDDDPPLGEGEGEGEGEGAGAGEGEGEEARLVGAGCAGTSSSSCSNGALFAALLFLYAHPDRHKRRRRARP